MNGGQDDGCCNGFQLGSSGPLPTPTHTHRHHTLQRQLMPAAAAAAGGGGSWSKQQQQVAAASSSRTPRVNTRAPKTPRGQSLIVTEEQVPLDTN